MLPYTPIFFKSTSGQFMLKIWFLYKFDTYVYTFLCLNMHKKDMNVIKECFRVSYISYREKYYPIPYKIAIFVGIFLQKKLRPHAGRFLCAQERPTYTHAFLKLHQVFVKKSFDAFMYPGKFWENSLQILTLRAKY